MEVYRLADRAERQVVEDAGQFSQNMHYGCPSFVSKPKSEV
jgi:hypothetical protein